MGEGETGREGKLPARFFEFLPALPRLLDPPLGSLRGRYPPFLPTCPAQAGQASQSDTLAVGMRTHCAGASFPFGFPNWTPKPLSPRGRKLPLGPRPPPTLFSLRLAARFTPMPPSPVATSEWPTGGGGCWLPGSGQGNGAG